MRSLMTFVKKEWMQQRRSVLLVVMGGLFALFGIMNPVTAKMTPWLLETLSESADMGGLVIEIAEVTAMDSWMQFFKNAPMVFIAFVVIQSNIFTREYGSGTLIMTLTKGLERYKVVVAKAAMLLVLWTVGYGVYFGLTYGITACMWDDMLAKNLGFSVFALWLFGVWLISLMVLFSTIFRLNIAVMGLTGAFAFGTYLMSALPKIKTYMPALLMDGNSLIFGLEDADAYIPAICVTIVLTVAAFAASVPIMNKRML